MHINSLVATTPVAAPHGGREQGTAGKVQNVGRDFESLLLAQLLKQMRVSGGEENSLFPGDSSDSLGSLFDLHMSQHLAAHGGLGLAKSLEQQLSLTTEATHG